MWISISKYSFTLFCCGTIFVANLRTFWRTFNRPKKYGGVPKMTIIRYGGGSNETPKSDYVIYGWPHIDGLWGYPSKVKQLNSPIGSERRQRMKKYHKISLTKSISIPLFKFKHSSLFIFPDLFLDKLPNIQFYHLFGSLLHNMFRSSDPDHVLINTDQF